MPRRKKLVKTVAQKLTQADKGRVILEETKEANVSAVSGYVIGELVQYYDSGWRAGHIVEMPVRGINRGHARVEHLVNQRKVWVDGTSLKKLEAPDARRPVQAAGKTEGPG